MNSNIINMNSFTEIINNYIYNYEQFKNGKHAFENEYGELIFVKQKDHILTIFGIYIFPEYRQIGLCRQILETIIDASHTKFKYVCVQSVLSKVLYEYLLRFNYNNKGFQCKKNGFFYIL